MESFPLSHSSWGTEEMIALQRVIQSGQFTMGHEVKKFEELFAQSFGHKFAVMVNSGSSANLLAIAALKIWREDFFRSKTEVIVPAVAWSTTYAPLHQLGFKMKVVDIDINTLNIDASLVSPALNEKTAMLLGVSILGNPAPLPDLANFCEQNKLLFIEDNCESLGASIQGKFTGTFGVLSTCSFFYAHHISTMEGGVVATDDPMLYELLLSLRAHGWTRNLPPKSLLAEQKLDTFHEAYRFILPGYNFRPLEFSGAVGIEQLKKINSMNEIRRRNYIHFCDTFRDDERFFLQKENGKSSSYCFTMVVNRNKTNFSRKEVLEVLRKNSIEFRMITGGNVMQHEYAKRMNIEACGELSNAQKVHEEGFFIGNGPVDLRKNIDQVHEVLKGL